MGPTGRRTAASCCSVGWPWACMRKGRRGGLLRAILRRYSLSSAHNLGVRRPAHAHAQSHRVLCLGRHRHHRRDLRQLDPGAVSDAAAARAPALHRLGGQGAGGAGRDQPGGRARGQAPIVFITLVNDEVRQRAHHRGLQGPGAGHVPHLRRAAGGGVRRQVQPPHRPLFRRRQERGVPRPHRRHQLLAGARRRAVGTQPGQRRRDPGRRQPQRQDADLAVPGHAAWHQGGQLPADPRRLRARQAAAVAGAAQDASASACRSTRSGCRRSATSGARAASTRRSRTAATRCWKPS